MIQLTLLATTLSCTPSTGTTAGEATAGEATASNDAANSTTSPDSGRADTGSGTTPGGTSQGPFSTLSWYLDVDIGSLVTVRWQQPQTATVHVEFAVDDGEWMSTPAKKLDAGYHSQILFGTPFGHPASWRVVDSDGNSTNGSTITTAALPAGLPVGTVTVSQPDRWLPGGDYLLTSINEEDGGWGPGTFWTMVVNRQGQPVWAIETPQQRWTLFAQVAVTGDRILWDANSYWSDWDDGERSRVYARYLDQEIEGISTPGLHHAFVQLPDGSLVWGSQDHGGYEALVEQAPSSADQTVLWSCWANWPGSGECKSNGLFYSVDRDSFLFSFYTNDSLVEVDHSTGESLWWAGEVQGGYQFAEGSRQFNWQHGISYTDTGSLLLSSRIYGAEAASLRPDASPAIVVDESTEAIEYSVDHDLGLLTEIWSYQPGVYAGTNGDTWRLDNGNTLHTLGSAGHVFEVDPDGEVVWHLDMLGDHMMGRSQWLADPYALFAPTGAR